MKNELEVVIVDDEPTVVDILSNFVLIAAPNARIHGFSYPLAARSYILANRVDLLITDHVMPNLDGILLAGATPKHVRKVVVSGYVSKISGEELKDLNAVVIAKPASMKVIVGIVSEEMGKVGI
ncbi:MAG TPA: response regulator [Chitinivibrionales bacterium]|nr:response regulator [Chitinivibrionales bacterium]